MSERNEPQFISAAPYYAADGIEIWHGDSRTIDAWDVAGGVMVTDPPYGIDYETNGGRDREFNDMTRARSVAGDADTRLRDNVLARWSPRPAIVFGSWKVSRPSSTRAVLTWHKGMNCGMGDLSIPWKPNTEEIYVLGTGFTGHRGSSVLDIQAPPSQVTWGRHHPTEKPVALMRALIAKCPPLATIVDPFMGSGTTLVAAQSMGRSAIGVEIDERYCEIAVKRLAQRSLFGMDGDAR